MTPRSNRPDPPTPRPLSNWSIAAGTLVVLAISAVVSFVLLRRYGAQGAQIQLDAIRTAGTLIVGTGGAVALLLTARRQRHIELTLVHTTSDATERRITELYTKAADQLGSEKAPVRLAGLHALERLAQNTPEQRQTIVDVVCAYLRMPYTPPDEHPPAEDAPAEAQTRYEDRRQEQQVRLTAQDILSRNLRINQHNVDQRSRRWWHRAPPPAVPNWPSIYLDLTGALLIEFSLEECRLDHANFKHAQFTGGADFRGVQFTGGAGFVDAQFTGRANFVDAQFTGGADFRGVQFTGGADFVGAQFTGWIDFTSAHFTSQTYFRIAQFTDRANFGHAQFTGETYFGGAQFTSGAYFLGAKFVDEADFVNAQFTGEANFGGAQFTGRANFKSAQFTGRANFWHAQFTGNTVFSGARMASTARPGIVWPPGWTTRPAKPDDGEDPAFLYLTFEVEKSAPAQDHF